MVAVTLYCLLEKLCSGTTLHFTTHSSSILLTSTYPTAVSKYESLDDLKQERENDLFVCKNTFSVRKLCNF